MTIRMSTQSELQHSTTILRAQNERDGGRQWLLESFDAIHGEDSTGTLTVRFNQGGITSVVFMEHMKMTQRELEERDRAYLENGNGHLGTRGITKVIS